MSEMKSSSGFSRLPRDWRLTPEALEQRWACLQQNSQNQVLQQALLSTSDDSALDCYQKNIENFIGVAKVPIGVAGPLRVQGAFAQGDYWMPLATTEAALVASYHRGAQLITRSGGAQALLLSEGVSRAPGFVFETLRQAGQFGTWALEQMDYFKAETAKTTRYGQLQEMHISLEGNHVYLRFTFTTGDAAGQNMVTLATAQICQWICAHSPVAPKYHFIEANFSGDKKASAQSFQTVRGKKVSAEVCVPARLVRRFLHTTPERMTDYWRMSSMGGVLSGTIGVQGHYANGLAALFLACGQDVACVAEAAVGVTRFELTDEGDLYAAVTLPNLIMGSVGGGTGLPTQQACLQLMGLAGEHKARALAEVTAALLLAGELSIIGALCAGHFARAHQSLARGR